MFKLPNQLPNFRASSQELADYIEYECLKAGSVFLRNAMRPINLIKDETSISGIDDESDESDIKLEEITIEIERREKASNGRYPFEKANRGYVLKSKSQDSSYWVYVYLLLSTRLNMRDNAVWNKIDGTAILEKLSAIVAKEYLGDRSDSFIFGTANSNLFKDKVLELCQRVGEGRSFQTFVTHSTQTKDDKLDIVAWKSFSDKAHSKLIGFGQCKTGTSWDDQDVIELQPEAFCRKWLLVQPVSSPIKMFFCSQYFPINEYDKVINAGIVFDRLRILDYLPASLDSALLKDIVDWCEAALTGIPLMKKTQPSKTQPRPRKN